MRPSRASTPVSAATRTDRRAGPQEQRRYHRGVEMRIQVTDNDGVFEPLERVEGARPGTIDTVCSEEELRDIRETVGWLQAAEQSVECWNTPADAVYATRDARRLVLV